jgi:hypothetical protein
MTTTTNQERDEAMRDSEWPEKEEGVAKLVDSWRAYISERPQLMSFLYDVDMLPEQIVSMRGAHSLDAVCCVYKAAENGQIPLRPSEVPPTNQEHGEG